MKKIFFLLLFLFGLTLPQNASNQIGSGTCGTDVTWVLTEDGTLTISGTGASYMQLYEYAAQVPWYEYRSMITSVHLDGVKVIGNYAFYGLSNLTTITIPNSVTEIRANAFYGAGLTEITIPESVTHIYATAFARCPLISVTIGKNVIGLDSSAFPKGDIIGDNLQYVYTDNEKFCSDTYFGNKITTLVIGDNVTKVKDYAFSQCSDINTVIIGKNVASIGKYAFQKARLEKTYCKSAIPPTSEGSGIGACNILYIPNTDDAKLRYMGDEYWCNVKHIQEYDMTMLEDVIPEAYLPVEENLIITEEAPYENTHTKMVSELTYTRGFANTHWQALYVPFKMNYEDWCNDFEVAKINNFHQFDTDDNGEFDNLQMEVIKVKSGTLKANHPYLIKAKSPGEKVIELLDTRLYACLEKNCVCNSMETTYTFTGTYAGVSGEDMYNNSYYSMGGGSLILAEDATANLKPYRWYLKMEGRDGQVIPTPSNVRVMVWDGETSSIESLSLDNVSISYHSLDGRMVTNAKSKGIYINNGKKVLR